MRMSSTSIKRPPWLAAGIAIVLAFQGHWMPAATARQAASKASAPAAVKSSAATAQPAAAKPSSLLPLSPADVLTHVRRSVDWYHDLAIVEQINLPGVDPGARSALQQQALESVHLALDFGKATADILGREAQAQAANGVAAPQSGPQTMSTQLQQAAANFSAQETTLKSKIADLDVQLHRSRGASARATLDAQRAGLVAALQLVQQIESNVDQLRHFQQGTVAGEGNPPKGMRSQLAALQHSIPELAGSGTTGKGAAGAPSGNGPTAAAASATSAAPMVDFQPQSAGILTLIGRFFTLHGYNSQLATATKDTTALAG